MSKKNNEKNFKLKIIKILSIFILIVVIANFFLYIFKIYPDIIFWAVIIVAAIFAFPVLNSMKNKQINR